MMGAVKESEGMEEGEGVRDGESQRSLATMSN